MGSFTRENYDSVSLLNKEVEEKEKELQKSKQEQAQENAQHQQELQDLRNEYEEKLRQIQDQNNLLKKQLEEEKGVNDEKTNNIATLEDQLKYFKFISVTYSFSKFTKE